MKTEEEFFEVKTEEDFFEAKTEEDFFEARTEEDFVASVALDAVSNFLAVKNSPPLLAVFSPFHLSPCSHPAAVGYYFAYAVCGG